MYEISWLGAISWTQNKEPPRRIPLTFSGFHTGLGHVIVFWLIKLCRIISPFRSCMKLRSRFSPFVDWIRHSLPWLSRLELTVPLGASSSASTVASLPKKGKHLPSYSPPAILILGYLSPIKYFLFSYVIIYSTFPSSLESPLSSFWGKQAWYMFLVFLSSSTPFLLAQ